MYVRGKKTALWILLSRHVFLYISPNGTEDIKLYVRGLPDIPVGLKGWGSCGWKRAESISISARNVSVQTRGSINGMHLGPWSVAYVVQYQRSYLIQHGAVCHPPISIRSHLGTTCPAALLIPAFGVGALISEVILMMVSRMIWTGLFEWIKSSLHIQCWLW